MKRPAGLVLAYPILFAVIPALFVAAENAGQYDLPDLFRIVAFIGALVAATLLVGNAAALTLSKGGTREHPAPYVVSALTMLAVAWLFYYVPVQNALSAVSWRLSRDPVLVPLGVVASVALIAALLRPPERLRSFGRFMTVFGVVLIGLSLVRLARSEARSPRAVSGSKLVARLEQPVGVRGRVRDGRNDPPRDIYLIVSDMHPNSAAAARFLGVDNSAVDDSLRALGFVVPADVRSNYVLTVLSLPSILNFEHLTELAEDEGRQSMSFTVPRYLIENNRAVRFLKSRGYKFLFFPSASDALTEHNHNADRTFDATSGHGLEAEARRTELRVALLENTLLGRLSKSGRPDAGHVLRTIEALKRVPEDPAPTFAFVHLMAPHPPYVLDANCRPLSKPLGRLSDVGLPGDRAPYVAQLRCVDKLLLGVATELRRASAVPPIILIVGDHGTRFSDPYFWAHPDRVPPAFVEERFGAFGAFLVPAGGDSLFAGRVSLVNVMRNVLRYYFNGDLPPLPNAEYVSGERLFDFFPVDTLTHSVRSAAPAGRSGGDVGLVGDR